MIRSLMVLFFQFSFLSYSQDNLVRDSGFENCKNCKSELTNNWRHYPLKYWSNANNTTSDFYFHSESNNGTPKNLTGFQNAKSGKGYAGFGSRNRWREYLQTELSKPLIKDSVYFIRFFVSLAESSKLSACHLGAYLAENKIHLNTYEKINCIPSIYESSRIIDTVNWVEISGTYKANGKEKFLIIGSFGDKKSFRRTKFKYPYLDNSAYYYLDDVTVSLFKSSTLTRKEENDSTNVSFDHPLVDLRKVFLLPDISFNTNESTLLPEVFSSLDSLAKVLMESKEINIRIEGHTDNVGSFESNKILSYDRANAVKEYLFKKGISTSRMQTQGFGDTKPIADNNIAEERKKNRRVEIVLF